MYLKTIEIQGFKSFANKIRFDFHNGITGIVGPNGSGKSNVADAVRWVLGEQRSKQLRGSSMQDVIFAGTEARKPLGFAQVSITLDNSDHQLPTDYNEVTVSRRIFRSGESEYLLNGTSCRLRDINELFYDTGIGKEGYSIIGQGQIDKILSDKPQDRRELFDEAAGIVKYKRRKDISVRKLADEQENMVRVGDILNELEKQVPTLQKQSEKAKVYLKEKETLRNLEVNVFLLENSRNLKEIEELSGKEKIASENLENSRKEYESSGAAYEAVQQRLGELEKEIEQKRSSITDAGVLRERIEGDIKVYEEQIRATQENASRLTSRRAAAEEEVRRRTETRSEILDRKAGIDAQAVELLSGKTECEKLLGEVSGKISELTDKEEVCRADLMDLLEERAVLRSKAASAQTSREQCESRAAELEEAIGRTVAGEAEQDDLLKSLREEFVSIADSITGAQKRQGEIEEEVSGFKQQLSAEDEALQAAQQAYHRQKSKLDALINLTERYEGFGGSVRRVMQNRRTERGIVGVVADLIKTEKKYETAIEVALGGSIQNIVVEDTGTAKRMIDLLKREKAGRATFLPLGSLSVRHSQKETEALREPGVIGTADSLVSVREQRCGDLAAFLLGRVLIVDTFANAAAVSKKYNRSIRMVTLDGELFAPGGAISGGTYKNSSNLLGRRREMAELEKEAQQLLADMRAHEAAITAVKERRTAAREQLEESRRTQQELFLKQNTVRLRIEQEQERQAESRGNREELLDEKEQNEMRLRSLKGEQEKAAAALEESARKEEALQKESAEIARGIAALREEETRRSQALSRIETDREKVLQQQVFEQQNLDRIAEELKQYRNEAAELEKTVQESIRTISARQAEIEQLRGELDSSREVTGADEEKLRRDNEERSQLNGELKELISKRESLSWDINLLDKECIRLHGRMERLQEQVDSRAAYMWEEYEITRSDAAAYRDETLGGLDTLRGEVTKVRARIKALGSVNVDSIEEYKTLMERYTFLKGQFDDLTKAAEDLTKIIEELDAAMRRKFKEEFARIQEEFDSVFRVMFGGGRGRLELMEDTDILEAGVRVIAQPPGKKLQNMMQLSGGEKALTAIALLFAIQNLKPSPFCLLDEIEAALDESNVERFAGYLHKLTENTQFIVITHRRGTMKEADRLYGITMQEKGVSALVSVDLIGEEDLQ